MLFAILLFVGTMLISLWASARVKSVYNRYSQVPAASGATGAEVAAAILQRAGIDDVEIVPHDEMLGDHYDPMNKRLVLSEQNYHGNSLAALGVAAHECGHAIQHKIAYAPLTIRMAAVGVTSFASQIVMWLPLIGIFTGLMSYYTGMWIMAIGWGVIMLFNLITLPVEFDASNRAKQILAGMGYIGSEEEMRGVRKTLDAAGWTYVAAFITSLAYLLWHLLPLILGGRSDDEIPMLMKTDPKPLIDRAEFNQFVESSGRKVTPATLQRLALVLPDVREKFAAVKVPGYTHAPAQLEFLARVVESVAADDYRDLSFGAIGEAAFALLYLAREIDVIPDNVEGIGFVDDAAVAATVIERNAVEFVKFAEHTGGDLAALESTTAE